jgi:hypothetical protein
MGRPAERPQILVFLTERRHRSLPAPFCKACAFPDMSVRVPWPHPRPTRRPERDGTTSPSGDAPPHGDGFASTRTWGHEDQRGRQDADVGRPVDRPGGDRPPRRCAGASATAAWLILPQSAALWPPAGRRTGHQRENCEGAPGSRDGEDAGPFVCRRGDNASAVGWPGRQLTCRTRTFVGVRCAPADLTPACPLTTTPLCHSERQLLYRGTSHIKTCKTGASQSLLPRCSRPGTTPTGAS